VLPSIEIVSSNSVLNTSWTGQAISNRYPSMISEKSFSPVVVLEFVALRLSRINLSVKCIQVLFKTVYINIGTF